MIMANFKCLVAMIEQITPNAEAHQEKTDANQEKMNATLREM
jgi:hypothetical protein